MVKEGWQYTDLSQCDKHNWTSVAIESAQPVAHEHAWDILLVDEQLLLPSHIDGVSFVFDGAKLSIHITKSLDRPMCIKQKLTDKAQELKLSLHVQIVLDDHCQANIDWHYDFSPAAVAYLHNVIDVELKASSQLEQNWYQQHDATKVYRLSQVNVSEGEAAQYRSLTLSSGLALDRTDTHVMLDGEGACVDLKGWYQPEQTHQSNHYLKVEH